MLNFGKYKYSPHLIHLLHGGMKDLFRRAIPTLNIIIDSTNINKTKRKTLITMLKNVLKEKDLSETMYDFVCVDFGPGDATSLNRRLTNLLDQEKELWMDTHKKFATMYEPPDHNEGFSSIIDGRTLEVQS